MTLVKRCALISVTLLTGCTAAHWDPTLGVTSSAGHEDLSRDAPVGGSVVTGAVSSPTVTATPVEKTVARFPGTGRFVKQVVPGREPRSPGDGDITLNFENTDIRQVVKVILGDLLGVNYILDPSVQGSATLETSRPLTRELLLPTLETLLRMNKAALINRDGVYRIVPIAVAAQGAVTPQLGENNRPIPKGYSIRIVPLNYIGATEMNNILKPLAPEGSVIRVDTVRNLLVLAGSSPEISNLLETIEVFDVNWIKGLSVGLFKIRHGNMEEITKQVETLFAKQDDNPLAGLFRVMPIESANSLLIVTHQPEYLDQAAAWIERLDQENISENDEPNLYVYRVKHGDANNLATILGQLFSGDQNGNNSTPRVAPGLRAASIQSRGTGGSNLTSSNRSNSLSSTSSRTSLSSKSASSSKGLSSNSAGQASSTGTAGAGGIGGAAGAAPGASFQLESGVSVVADTTNNAVLIRAIPSQYRKLQQALEQLDIMPLQVLVEATIVEVSLNGDLKYGLQWFFQGQNGDYKHGFNLDGTLDKSDSSGLSSLFPGFNWTLTKGAGDVRAVLSAFAGEGLINVLSSPTVMVLDNHTAQIQVGDEVPIVTSQQSTVISTTANPTITNAVEYRATGVMLSVTPRVTPGGLVMMDVQQEVSDVATTSKSSVSSPTIQTRNIASTVAVKQNQSVVLGGLIRDRKEGSESGLPGLYKLPAVGWLFGQTAKSASRTELVVILTPHILSGDHDIEKVTADFRTRLQGLKEKF